MKNKVIKKIAAAGTALMMAVTGMAMSASAASHTQSWMVRRVIINGNISSESISTTSNTFTPSSGQVYYGVDSNCTSFSTGQTANGNRLGVWYYLYVLTYPNGYNSDPISKTVDGKHIQYNNYSITKSTILDPYVSYGQKLKAKYTIDNPYTISCYMSGQTIGYSIP